MDTQKSEKTEKHPEQTSEEAVEYAYEQYRVSKYMSLRRTEWYTRREMLNCQSPRIRSETWTLMKRRGLPVITDGGQDQAYGEDILNFLRMIAAERKTRDEQRMEGRESSENDTEKT